jgi:heat shock protein HtpX
MSFFKRIFLYMLVNILVVVTVSITMSILGVGHYITRYGIDYEQLAIFCLIWGMVGSFVSLQLSRFMAKRMMGVQVIDPNTRDSELQSLVQTIYQLAKAAQLPVMPEVGIYDSPELNAFATGPSKSRALVAVSSGLIGRMNQNELEGVLGHEITHIANGDMVTMTLLQGVINAFVMFLSRVLAFAIAQAFRGDRDEDRGPGFLPYLLTPIFEIFFSFFGMIIVAWFSRYREFRADAGGAHLAGREKMIAALQALKRTVELPDAEQAPPAIAAFQINEGRKKGFLELFSTHPPLDERIAALETNSTK